MSVTLRAADRKAARAAPPAFLAKGFRPFYLLAGLQALLWIPLWLAVLNGLLPVPGHFDPIVWHGHEMLFGYAAAVLVGFLLTAIPNWTGLPTPTGLPLGLLALLWLAGRLLMLGGGALPAWLVAAADSAFLPAAGLVMLPPLVRSRNRRNIVFPFLLIALGGANLVIHLDQMSLSDRGTAGLDAMLGAMAVIMVLMTGRVVPFFSRNALPQAGIGRNERLDSAALAAAALAAVAGVAAPASLSAGLLAGLAAILLAARAVPWRPLATRNEPMLWVLHAGHFWIAVAFALWAVAAFDPAVIRGVPVHALTVGAIGSLTLGMMARSALGHTGRRIAAGPAIAGAFIAINLAALLRAFGPLVWPDAYDLMLLLSGAAWTLAFGLFVIVFLPILTRPRIDCRPG